MKALAILGALSVALSGVQARIAVGSCSGAMSNAVYATWDATMGTPSNLYLHYTDNMIYNGYELFNIMWNKKVAGFDCLSFSNFFSGMTSTDYTTFITSDLNGKYGLGGGVTQYDATTTTFTIQVCIDAGSLAIGLTQLASFGITIPSWANTILGIATWGFQFIHYEATGVLSGQDDISSYTSTLSTFLQTAAGGNYKMAMLT